MTDLNSEDNISVILKKNVRVFISYSTEDKRTAGMIQNKYSFFNIESFLAHEDLKVSEEWKERIIQELNYTDVIVALLSKNFRSSDWTSQEIGFALQRKLLCIPLSLDETQPYGFFGHLQGKKISKAPADSDLDRYLIPPLLGKFPSVHEVNERRYRPRSLRNPPCPIKATGSAG